MNLILTSAGTNNPFVLHKAVLLEDGTILHNTNDNGKPVSEPLTVYLNSGRKILWCGILKTDADTLRQRHAEVEHEPYNAASFNCEHYTNHLTEDAAYSPQIVVWVLFALLVILLISKR